MPGGELESNEEKTYVKKYLLHFTGSAFDPEDSLAADSLDGQLLPQIRWIALWNKVVRLKFQELPQSEKDTWTTQAAAEKAASKLPPSLEYIARYGHLTWQCKNLTPF